MALRAVKDLVLMTRQSLQWKALAEMVVPSWYWDLPRVLLDLWPPSAEKKTELWVVDPDLRSVRTARERWGRPCVASYPQGATQHQDFFVSPRSLHQERKLGNDHPECDR